jgi:hypothetical protein
VLSATLSTACCRWVCSSSSNRLGADLIQDLLLLSVVLVQGAMSSGSATLSGVCHFGLYFCFKVCVRLVI